MAKKVLIANTLGGVADRIFALPVEQFDAFTAWVGAVAYTLQIYYDFSGYSDMAIGLCLIFGFKIPENFNYPYISKTITEFWRRWHISLSSWFKLYLYIPLGGNRVPKWRNILNLFIVFLVTGIWHGASWVFIVWGLWHGFFVILEKVTGLARDTKNFFLNSLKHAYAIIVFIVGWVIFRADTLSFAISYVKTMFGFSTLTENSADKVFVSLNNAEILAFIIGLIFVFPIARNILNVGQNSVCIRLALNALLLFMFFISVAELAGSTYNPFIYFRF